MPAEIAVKMRRKAAIDLLHDASVRLAAVVEVEPMPEIPLKYNEAWDGVPMLEAAAQLIDRVATALTSTTPPALAETAAKKPRKDAA